MLKRRSLKTGGGESRSAAVPAFKSKVEGSKRSGTNAVMGKCALISSVEFC
jgi:hypothetical protein